MKTQGLSAEWRREQARKQQALQEAAAVARLNKAARLYDNLRQQCTDERLLTMLTDATVIDINNVADYVHSVGDLWIKTLPDGQIAPFARSFVEFEMGRVEPKLDYVRVGMLVSQADYRAVPEAIAEGYAFGLLVHYFFEIDALVKLLPVVGAIGVNEYGQRSNGPGGLTPFPTRYAGLDTMPLEEGAYGLASVPTNIMMLAFGLMNCRNVQLIDQAPNRYTSEKYERHFGVPLTTYKVLKVTPMRKWRPDAPAPDDGTAHLPKSLHIMRGHFKDYRNGAGLFGKYQDIFWWDSHVRGDESRGVTVKDYEVEAPA